MQIINMQIFQMGKKKDNFPKISIVFNSGVAILYLQVLQSEQYCLFMAQFYDTSLIVCLLN